MVLTPDTRAEARLRLLAELGPRLAAIADADAMLREIAALAIPGFADWCVVDVLDGDGGFRRVAAVDGDDERAIARHLESLRAGPSSPIGEVVRTGRPIHVTASEQSVVIAPLVARGRTLGVLSFVYGPSGRRHDADDVAYLEMLASRAAVVLDTTRLLDGERRLRGELETLFALTAAANRATSLADLLEPALDAITRLAGVARASILLFDDDGVMRFVAARGLSEAYRAAVEGHSPWSRDTRGARPIVVEDWRADPSLAAYGPVFEAEDVRALAFVPLVDGDELLGKFMLYDARPRLFTAHELGLAETAGAQIAQAFARERLLARERAARARAERQAERTRRLQAVIGGLAGALVPDDIARIALTEGVAALGASTAGLWRLEDDRLVLIGTHAYPDELVRSLATLELDPAVPVCDAALRGVPVWLETREDYAARYPVSEARTRAHAGRADLAVACMPLRVDERVLGVIALRFTDARRFDDEERAFLEILAHSCAEALDRARLYEEAMRAIAIRDEFLSVAGHELKTPLTALLLQAQALERSGGAPPAVVERLRKLTRHSGRIARLIDELLDVTRISAERLRLELEDVELAPLIAENVARLADESARTGSRIDVEVGDGVCGRWDRARVDQVVTNLLSNAVKYGQGKPIDVRAVRVEGAAILTVRDRGIGIAREDQERIFARFERAVSSRHYGGLGLGLWIARQIVEAHGGAIAVDSAPGEGAEFRVKLPLEPARR